ncbi:unnamed protein product [Adineta steineri]|uniref:Uncharacterized protein n=1 Tax=Adineta steineri TaxID=433720 RepID=A0A814II17_9BILA|nr:unnamed protein product [Adineta steineri]CAF1044970.1 unnamed protein product [Adineta steineri]
MLTLLFSSGWTYYGNIIICSIVVIPTIFFLPILQRTRQFIRLIINTYHDLVLSSIRDQFSIKLSHKLYNKTCSSSTDCTFDARFNRPLTVKHIQIESKEKNCLNYRIRILHILSSNIRILPLSNIKLTVQNQFDIPRKETMIGINVYPTISVFEIDIKVQRCEINDSPFLLLFTRLMTNIVLMGEGSSSVLSNGKVLVTGGWDSGVLNSAELYDPSTGTWTTTGNMNNARIYHTASVLSNGKVLVTGGYSSGSALNSAELYDPSTGTWTTTGNMANAREYHTSSVLLNGKVLVTGGVGNTGYLNSAELYDPSTGIWTPTGNMNNARQFHRASVLSNGKVLVTGGIDNNFSLSNSAELYDPLTSTWTTSSNMNNAREWHTASVLLNGIVLVTGGSNNAVLNSAELY